MKEHAVAFVVWLMEFDPDAFYKYMEDPDGGKAAMEDFYDMFKNSSEVLPDQDPQATDYDYGYGDLD